MLADEADGRGGGCEGDGKRRGESYGRARRAEQGTARQQPVEHGGNEAGDGQCQRFVADGGAEPEKHAGAPSGVRIIEAARQTQDANGGAQDHRVVVIDAPRQKLHYGGDAGDGERSAEQCREPSAAHLGLASEQIEKR